MKYALNNILLILLVFSSPGLKALETDQFLTWGVSLRDSKEALNIYIEKKMREKAQTLKNIKSCEKAAISTLKVFRRPFFQIIEGWAEHSEQVDVYPPRNYVGSYRHDSILRKNVFPWVLPMASTINVNGIYFGTDKLGHFTSFGLRYFNVYRRALKNGHSKQSAMMKAVRFGIWFERFLVGKLASGVLSFGDLEANFQGLLFTISLCQEGSPFKLISKNKGKWELHGKFDITPYINPWYDESFNESAYRRDRWRGKTGVSNSLKKYCIQRSSPWVLAQNEYYSSFSPSFNAIYIDYLEKTFVIKDRHQKRLRDLCVESDV